MKLAVDIAGADFVQIDQRQRADSASGQRFCAFQRLE